jgi:hypothetical protein
MSYRGNLHENYYKSYDFSKWPRESVDFGYLFEQDFEVSWETFCVIAQSDFNELG